MNVRLIIQKGFVAVVAALALSSCDMMTEDLSDCPTGLYVNFVYDYNIQRADMFKDHVGGLTLYVYDESDRLVASKTMGEGQLSKYGSYIHFSEEELAPDHSYRLMAVAFQHELLSNIGAKYRLTGPTPSCRLAERLADGISHSRFQIPQNGNGNGKRPQGTLRKAGSLQDGSRESIL